jgi:type 1 glutamine amidotransferase
MQSFTKRFLIAATCAALGVAAVADMDFFQAADANQDGYITRDELRTAMTQWLGGRKQVDQKELASALNKAFPESTFMGMISPPQSRTPKPEDQQRMEAALPASAPAKPMKPRKVLVLCKAAGFVHSSIPLAAKTVEELGTKTGAWTTDVSYDSSVITAKNLKQYDLVFLDSTTGFFLDDADATVTAARKKALLDFVRSGKGLAGIHAAADSYHQASDGPEIGGMIAPGILAAADTNEDKTLDAAELSGLADKWFDMADAGHTGKVSVQDFKAGFGRILFSTRGPARAGAPPMPPAAKTGPDHQYGTWPEFNKMIGGYFKFHWVYPQHIVYKIDDPNSPLTAMFKNGFAINDETYTFGVKSWSRENVHVLTSIDYSKMSAEDKAKEDYPRADHDYGLSWIRREGKGRVFYMAHGHAEEVYANPQMLQHLLAGIQYALGDLKADDKASAKEEGR